MRILWKQHYQGEDWGFLLIDTHNALNEKSCTDLLWEVSHECPSGARFTFN